MMSPKSLSNQFTYRGDIEFRGPPDFYERMGAFEAKKNFKIKMVK